MVCARFCLTNFRPLEVPDIYMARKTLLALVSSISKALTEASDAARLLRGDVNAVSDKLSEVEAQQ